MNTFPENRFSDFTALWEMIHWEIEPMIGHKLLMLLEQVLSLNVFAHRRAEFLRYLCPDVSGIVHHRGSCFLWKEHLPDLLMAAQPAIYFILHRSRAKCFLAVLWPFSVRQTGLLGRLKSLFWIAVSQAKVFTPSQLSRTQKDTLSTCPWTLPLSCDVKEQ